MLYQQKHYDGSGAPANVVRGEDIPIGARILKVLIDLLELETQKLAKAEALKQMQQREPIYIEPDTIPRTSRLPSSTLSDSSLSP